MTQEFSSNRLVTAKYALNPSLRVPGMQQGQDILKNKNKKKRKEKNITNVKIFRARFREEQTGCLFRNFLFSAFTIL